MIASPPKIKNSVGIQVTPDDLSDPAIIILNLETQAESSFNNSNKFDTYLNLDNSIKKKGPKEQKNG